MNLDDEMKVTTSPFELEDPPAAASNSWIQFFRESEHSPSHSPGKELTFMIGLNTTQRYAPLSTTASPPHTPIDPSVGNANRWLRPSTVASVALFCLLLASLAYTLSRQPLHTPTCLPEDWSDGSWELKSPLPTSLDPLVISGYEGCASTYHVEWHFAIETWPMSEYRRRASNWKWVPGGGCQANTEFVKEQVVKDLVEKGGWMFMGGELIKVK